MYLNRCCTTTTATATTTTCWYHWPKFKSGICSRRQKDRHKHIQTWRQKHRPTKRETDRQTDRRPKQKKRLFWRNSLVGVFFLSASRRLSFFSTKFVLLSLPPTTLAFVSRPFGVAAFATTFTFVDAGVVNVVNVVNVVDDDDVVFLCRDVESTRKRDVGFFWTTTNKSDVDTCLEKVASQLTLKLSWDSNPRSTNLRHH